MSPKEVATAVADDQRNKGAINVEVKETKISDMDAYLVESYHSTDNVKVFTYFFLDKNKEMHSISAEGPADKVVEAVEIVEKTFSLTK